MKTPSSNAMSSADLLAPNAQVSAQTSELKIAASIVKEAIDWMLKLQSAEVDDATEPACANWRAENPAHEQAWQRITSLNSNINQNLSALPDTHAAYDVLQAAEKRMERRKALKLLSLAVVVGSTAGISHQITPWPVRMADYATPVGTRRTITLDDGTVLNLNSDSAINVRFSETQRLIELVHGEILITSGHNDNSATFRPLRASTQDALFTALGTRFILRKNDASTQLDVMQGAVAIEPTQAGAQRVVAKAGQSYIATSLNATLLGKVDNDSSAWVDGSIVAKNMRLADFISEVSRYRTGVLRCDEAIVDLRISGVFQIEDTDKLLSILPQTLPVDIAYKTRWWVTVVKI